MNVTLHHAITSLFLQVSHTRLNLSTRSYFIIATFKFFFHFRVGLVTLIVLIRTTSSDEIAEDIHLGNELAQDIVEVQPKFGK